MGFFYKYLEVDKLAEDETVVLNGHKYIMRGNMLRVQSMYSNEQSQTADIYGRMFAEDDVFDEEASIERQQKLIQLNFPDSQMDIERALREDGAKVLDVGVGNAISSYILLKNYFDRFDYCGIEIAEGAADEARRFLKSRQIKNMDIIQSSMLELPFNEPIFDLVVALGCFHRTDSVKGSLIAVSKLLKPCGVIMFSIQKQQPPVRALLDNYIRDSVSPLNFTEQVDIVLRLTTLGRIMGDAIGDVEVVIPYEIPIFEIPAGSYKLQTLLYDYMLRLYYSKSLTEKRLLWENIDWFVPKYLHQTSVQAVRQYCLDAGYGEPEINNSFVSNMMGVVATKTV